MSKQNSRLVLGVVMVTLVMASLVLTGCFSSGGRRSNNYNSGYSSGGGGGGGGGNSNCSCYSGDGCFASGNQSVNNKQLAEAIIHYTCGCGQYNHPNSCYLAGVGMWAVGENSNDYEYKKLAIQAWQKGCNIGSQESCQELNKHR